MGKSIIYAPGRILCTYLTVFSWFLISFVMGGVGRAGRTSCFMHLLLQSLSMGSETSFVGSCASNHLCTYYLYSPVHNVFGCVHIHYLGKWEEVARLLSPGPPFLVIFSTVFLFSLSPSFSQLSLTVVNNKSTIYAVCTEQAPTKI